MKEPLDFQSVIMTLQKFWADQGCLIWQPYYNQIGAGTMNPGTFLRVLGPEPWNVAYVEPSIRPDDGRYGENPNRFQQHYQFQVILKPDPGNPQELYLKSLEALGINPREHDIRFVEDNWQQPALGAWGLGWEVWMDGQEITQFTYFQQAGGITLDPVAVEITYGLERITMPLQRIPHARNMHWNKDHTYGEINFQGEVEHSKYYFEIADVDRMRQLYSLYEAEAEEALKNGLVLPAHDYILKCSHTFNILDTRGAVGVTERQALFGRMREMAHRNSEAYVEQRRKLEFPWLNESLIDETKTVKKAAKATLPVGPAPFLVEIGTEELPAADLQSALEQLTERIPALLDELRLAHGEIKILGTPRRLIIYVDGLADQQAERTTVVKGPPESRAFDATGQATRALEGFAQGKGVSVKDLEAREIDGGRYMVALVKETTRPAYDVLLEALPTLVAGIKFDKVMRWNFTNVAFSRPIRWLLAMLGTASIPFEYAGLTAAAVTHGLRFIEPQELQVKDAKDYFAQLKAQGILVDPAERKETIRAQVYKIMAGVNALEKVDEDLLDEVNTLVEAPTALLGTFDAAHLSVPTEALISVMKKHQRYFPVLSKDGKLMPHFIAVRNGDKQGLDVVTDGNEQVIRARFADANFFINEDLKHKLSDMLEKLGTLTFQQKLGSMLDKSVRIRKMVEKLGPQLGLTSAEQQSALRAAELCKADLVTHMVVENTSLQGVMGRYYAKASGENEEVAQALFEHYLPRFMGDAVPSSKVGLVIGLADRLDSLAGLFAAGLAPTGTKDPFAQRRTALGLVQCLSSFDLDFDLKAGLDMASKNMPISVTSESLQASLDFIVGRLKNSLTDQGFHYDVVEAVLAEQQSNPAGVIRAVHELSAWVNHADWATILPAYARCVRITRDQKTIFAVDPANFEEKSEEALYKEIEKVEKTSRREGSVDDLIKAFQPIIPTVNQFFDAVLVMAENEKVRSNRLGMLQRIAALAKDVADFSCLEGF
ncbi:MAG TPA: glycine--tRNA ligase subunit alpha/beta [Anaerolineaceae bacterium]|nr:glycine--tRNA ligase subunit alpha/beta [Anaerolineaceae bacterium]